jgi:hypothetical protein
MTLTDLCTTYQSDVEALDPAEVGYAVRLTGLTQKLALDAAGLVVDFPFGEAVALIQLAGNLLQWLKSEAEDPTDLQRRYGRQQAVLDLMVFAHALVGYLGASQTWQRENLPDHRQRVANALAALLP